MDAMGGSEILMTGNASFPPVAGDMPGLVKRIGYERKNSVLIPSMPSSYAVTKMVPSLISHIWSVKVSGQVKLQLPKKMPKDVSGAMDMEKDDPAAAPTAAAPSAAAPSAAAPSATTKVARDAAAKGSTDATDII